MASVLITGGTGYLGGSLLAHLSSNYVEVPHVGQIYALVRNGEQAAKVRQHYNAEPLTIDLEDQKRMIKSLAKIQQETGIQTHFLHTTGAKAFSSHAGFPIEQHLNDEDDLYDVQKGTKSSFPPMQEAVETNNSIIETATAHGVRAYILVPCIVYGKGTGFGNKLSIQTVAIVKAAKAAGRVYKVDKGMPNWPVCHISDITSLYARLLLKMASGEDVGYNKQGYYLAASGLASWDDIYAAMAKALVTRNVIKDAAVMDVDESALRLMAKGLSCPEVAVPVLLGGSCTLRPTHAGSIGWTAQYKPRHIIEAADGEVELILRDV